MALVLERRIPPGPAALWRRCAAGFGDDGPREDARSRHSIAFKLSVFSGIALLGAFWGSAVAIADLEKLRISSLNARDYGIEPPEPAAGRNARLVPASRAVRRQPPSIHAAPAALAVYRALPDRRHHRF